MMNKKFYWNLLKKKWWKVSNWLYLVLNNTSLFVANNNLKIIKDNIPISSTRNLLYDDEYIYTIKTNKICKYSRETYELIKESEPYWVEVYDFIIIWDNIYGTALYMSSGSTKYYTLVKFDKNNLSYVRASPYNTTASYTSLTTDWEYLYTTFWTNIAKFNFNLSQITSISVGLTSAPNCMVVWDYLYNISFYNTVWYRVERRNLGNLSLVTNTGFWSPLRHIMSTIDNYIFWASSDNNGFIKFDVNTMSVTNSVWVNYFRVWAVDNDNVYIYDNYYKIKKYSRDLEFIIEWERITTINSINPIN